MSEAAADQSGESQSSSTTSTTSTSSSQPQPSAVQLSVDNASPPAGTKATLSWHIPDYGGQALTLASVPDDLSSGQQLSADSDGNGSVEVAPVPGTTISYTVNLKLGDGSTISSNTVEVTAQPGVAPVANLRLEGPSDAAAPGAQVSLKWSFEGDAASAAIDRGVGDLDISAGGSGTASASVPQDAQDGPITFTLSVAPKDGSAVQTVTADLQVKAAVQPSVDDFKGALKEDDGIQHLPDSLQVVVETPILLSWTVSNAPDGVELKGPDGAQAFDASVTSSEVTPKEETQDYQLVALAGQTRSQAKTVHVSTHPHGHLYSPHTHVLPPGAPAKIEKFVAYASDGGTLDAATDTVSLGTGAKLKLHIEVSGEADSITIDNGAPDLSLDDEGMGEVEVTPELEKDATELVYTLTVKPSNPGEDTQTATVHVKLQEESLVAVLFADLDHAAAGDTINFIWAASETASRVEFKVTPAPDSGDGVLDISAATHNDDGSTSCPIKVPDGASGTLSYQLTAYGPSDSNPATSEPVEIAAGGANVTGSLSLALDPLLMIPFRVLGPDGNPIKVDSSSSVTTDAVKVADDLFLTKEDGKATFENIPVGAYTLVFAGSGAADVVAGNGSDGKAADILRTGDDGQVFVLGDELEHGFSCRVEVLDSACSGTRIASDLQPGNLGACC